MRSLKSMDEKGQILAEVVVAIGIIIIVLIGMSQLMSRTTKTIRRNTFKDAAASLVNDQIRWYKVQRDADTAAFFKNVVPAPVGTGPGFMRVYIPCGGPNGGWFIPTPSPTLTTTISCSVQFDDTGLSGNGVTVTVKATWTETTADDSNLSLSSTIMKF